MNKFGTLEMENRDLHRKLKDERKWNNKLEDKLTKFRSLLRDLKPYPCEYKDDMDAYYRIKHYMESINVLHEELKAKGEKIIELEHQNVSQQTQLTKLEEELAQLKTENREVTAKQKELETIHQRAKNRRIRKERELNRLIQEKKRYMKRNAKVIKPEMKKGSNPDEVSDIEEEYQKLEMKFKELDNVSVKGRLERAEELKKMFADYDKNVPCSSKGMQTGLLIQTALEKLTRECKNNDVIIEHERKKQLDILSSKWRSITQRKTQYPTRAKKLLNDIRNLYSEVDGIDIIELEQSEKRESELLQELSRILKPDNLESSLINILEN